MERYIFVQTHKINNMLACKLNFKQLLNNNILMCIEATTDVIEIIMRKLSTYLNSQGYNYMLESTKRIYKKEIINIIKPYLETLSLKYKIYKFNKL